MTKFSYRAFSTSGDLAKGMIDADSQQAAENAVRRLGLTPFECRDATQSRFSFSLSGRKSKPSAARLAAFTREFATLEQAGIPLDQSLRLLSTQDSSSPMRKIAEGILQKVVDGGSLSQALAEQPDVFDHNFVQIIRGAESVGRVGAALTEMAEMLERRQELRRRVQNALIYPALLILMAIASTGVVLSTLVPNIAPIFADNDKPMPAGLGFLIGLESHGGEILIGIAIITGAVFFGLRMTAARPVWSSALDRALLRIPVLGPLLQKYAAACFARTLGSMLKAGAPILQALDSARLAVGNHYLRACFAKATDGVRGGVKLSAALRDIEFFPSAASQMIAVGEESGQTPAMLLRLAALFERDTQTAIERVMAMLTPALTVIIATVVGGLIMTIMDAVLSINDLANK